MVDLQSRPEVNSTVSEKSNRPRRAVHFSPFSQCLLFETSEGEDSSRITHKDKTRFRRELAREAQRLGRILATLSPDDVNQEDIYGCVGIENLISLDEARRAAEHKRDHARLILEAQGRCSKVKLGRILHGSSRPARERSQELAAGYWGMLDG